MNALENFVSPALMRALGWTLLHSLWQGALVAAVLAGALLLLRRQRAEVRYVASAGALGVVVALAGITFGLYFQAGPSQQMLLTPGAVKSTQVSPAKPKAKPATLARPIRLAATEVKGTHRGTVSVAQFSAQQEPLVPLGLLRAGSGAASETPSAVSNWLAVGLRYFDNHLPLLVVGWLMGLLAMSLRMLGGLLYVQRLRRYRVRPLSATWQARFAALAERSGVRRPVALLESALVQVPLVVGHLRPVILLPFGVVAGLSPASLEAILAHELAHVLRRDYLVNLLQTVAEVLFFYHPAVWFVANCVRTERENCCDDTATALCGGDSLRLARALTALAEWSQSAVVPATPRLALAAMGRRGALLSRVRRLVQHRPAAPTLAEGIMAGALVLGGLGLLGSSVAFARPLTQPTLAPAKLMAFDWQGGAGQGAPQTNGAGDTIKFVSGSGPGQSLLHVAVNGTTIGSGAHRFIVAPDEFGVNRLVVAQDTTPRDRASRRRAERERNRRRVSIIDRGDRLAPATFRRAAPGAVVITKDKKGRITDLVVNGERIETDNKKAGKRKIKIKDKKGGNIDERQVEVIRVVPRGSSDDRNFVYRSEGGNVEFRRLVPGTNFRYRTVVPGEQRIYHDVMPQLNRLEELRDGNRTFRVLKPGLQTLGSDLRANREALRTAEDALRKASAAKNLSAEERKSISKGLEEVRAQLKATEQNAASSSRVLRLNGDQLQTLELANGETLRAMRLRQQGDQDRQEVVVREQRREELRERIRESQRELREMDRSRAERTRSNEDAVVTELLKDGLIKDRNNFQFKLTAKSLVVDGKEQPQKVLDKYLKLYETNTGRKITGNSSWMMGRNGDMRTIDVPAPQPPQAPGAPRSPKAPRAPKAPRGATGLMAPPAPPLAPAPAAYDAPAPPRPPKAPSMDTKALRDELRKDGLIGANDKSFQMQLNDAGLTVNGKRQPDELAAKYRKLVGHDGPGQVHNLNVSFTD